MLKIILFSVVVIFTFTNCSERNLSTASFNVYFWHPENLNEKHLGTVQGLDQCSSAALNYASSKNLSRSDGWSYICCLKTSNSECSEKHR